MLPKPGKRVPGPYYDLEAFKAEVRADNVHVYRTRAVDIIRSLLNCSRDAATEFAKRAVLSLKAEDYAHTLEVWGGQSQDVYGLLIEGTGWYLKIEIHVDDGEPGIVSCHPAEYDLRTRRGMVPGARK